MEKLMELAKHLPTSGRKEFLTRAGQRVGELAIAHTNTMVFGAAGWVLGEIVDNLLQVPMPFTEMVIELTADNASDVGLVGGVIHGFLQDKKKAKLRSEVTQILGEELRRAMAAS